MPRVKLLRDRQIERNGRITNHKAGEWVEVGKMWSDQWIRKGIATLEDTVEFRDGCGVAIPANTSLDVSKMFGGIHVSVWQWLDSDDIPYPRTVLWTGDETIRPPANRIAEALTLLDVWQIAVPMCDYAVLAKDVGSENERAKTEKLIHDLRVPVYDTNLIFMRRCPDTAELLNVWRREYGARGDIRLSFLRALYEVKPLIQPLPFRWGMEK